MPLMIWAAIAIELAINNYIDMGILLGILFMNASISFYEMTKAGDAVAALKVRDQSTDLVTCLATPTHPPTQTNPYPSPLPPPPPPHTHTPRPRSSPWRTSSATGAS